MFKILIKYVATYEHFASKVYKLKWEELDRSNVLCLSNLFCLMFRISHIEIPQILQEHQVWMEL